MRRYVRKLGEALVARSIHQAADNQAIKVELAHDILRQAAAHFGVGNHRAGRRVLREAGKFLHLADAVEARMMGMVGLGPAHMTAHNLNFLVLDGKSVAVSPEVLQLLGAMGANAPALGLAAEGEDGQAGDNPARLGGFGVDGQSPHGPPPALRSELTGILGEGNPADGPDVLDVIDVEYTRRDKEGDS